MPNRIVREAILSSESVSKLTWAEEVFYRRLMSIVDDHGRFEANVQLIRARCYPLQTDDVKASEVAKWLETCSHHGLIVLYAVDGKRYLELVKFHQQTRSPSKCPAPDISCYQVPAAAHLGVVVVGDVVEGVSVGECDTTAQSTPAPDPCPHSEIIALYHEILPTAVGVKVWTDKRAKALRARWKEDEKRQTLDYWRRLFEHISASDWLMGRVEGKDRRTFAISLDWIIGPENFAKIVEGKYHDRRG